MKRLALYLLLIFSTADSFALETADLIDDKAALEVLNKNCIRLGTSELVPIEFSTLCAVLDRSGLIEALQYEFARTISKNGQVDFPVFQDGPGKYHYTDESGHRTDLKELYRKQTDAHSYDFIILASGRRFFGKYDVVVHLQVVDAGTAGVAYSVAAHAYPHNWLTRFSLHKIGLTKGYFKDKMQMISYIAREIAVGLCEQEDMRNKLNQAVPPSSNSVMQLPDRSPVQARNPAESFRLSP